jgi:intracellular sulfur oxidation DsrE/DsrF family protein
MKFTSLLFLLLVSLSVSAQTSKDTVGTFPVIKKYKWANVMDVPDKNFKPDPSLKYKIVIDLTAGPKNEKDSIGYREANWGFGEVGRRLNLHVADGIPVKNIDIVVAVHGFALFSMLNNESYKKKYGVDNPSLTLIDELKKCGVKFVVCGQAMNFMSVESKDLISNSTIGLTAQTVLTSYQMKGYLLQTIEPED